MGQNKKIIILVIVLLLLAAMLSFIFQEKFGNKKEALTKNNITTMKTKQVEKEDEIKEGATKKEETGSDAEIGESNEVVFDGTLSKIEGKSAIFVKDRKNEEELKFYINSETKISLMELLVKNPETGETELKDQKPIQLNEVKIGDGISVVSVKSADEEKAYLAKEIRKVVIAPAN